MEVNAKVTKKNLQIINVVYLKKKKIIIIIIINVVSGY